MLCFVKKEEKSRHENRVFYAFRLKLIVGYCRRYWTRSACSVTLVVDHQGQRRTKRREAGDSKGPLPKPRKAQTCSICSETGHNSLLASSRGRYTWVGSFVATYSCLWKFLLNSTDISRVYCEHLITPQCKGVYQWYRRVAAVSEMPIKKKFVVLKSFNPAVYKLPAYG
jgi:hypothetical protein